MMISMLCTLLAAGAPNAQPVPAPTIEVPQTNPQADQSDEGEEFSDDEEGYSLEDFQEEPEPKEDGS